MANEGARVVEKEEAYNDLYLTGVEFAGEEERRELGRGSYGVVYEVMWRGTPCAAKKIHPLLLEAVPGGVGGCKNVHDKTALLSNCAVIVHQLNQNHVKYMQ